MYHLDVLLKFKTATIVKTTYIIHNIINVISIKIFPFLNIYYNNNLVAEIICTQTNTYYV